MVGLGAVNAAQNAASSGLISIFRWYLAKVLSPTLHIHSLGMRKAHPAGEPLVDDSHAHPWPFTAPMHLFWPVAFVTVAAPPHNIHDAFEID